MRMQRSLVLGLVLLAGCTTTAPAIRTTPLILGRTVALVDGPCRAISLRCGDNRPVKKHPELLACEEILMICEPER